MKDSLEGRLNRESRPAFKTLNAGYGLAGTVMQMDAHGKVYAKLDAEELRNIAKVVINELRKENRDFHPATLSL